MTKNEKMKLRRKRRILWRIKQIVFLSACLALIIVAGTSLIRFVFHGGSSNPQQQVLKNSSQYPKPLVELVKKNPETAEFVADYSKYAGKHFKISLKQDYTKGELPYFLQWDKRWGYETYNDNFFALTGCGPTCLSMVVVGLTGDLEANPLTIAQYSEEHGYTEKGKGTKWSFMTEGAEYFNVKGTELGLSETEMKKALKAGHPMIAIMGAGDFTTQGHFIVLYDTNKNGEFKIYDPNSIENSKKTWSFKTLKSQIKNLWSYAPM